MSDFIYVLQVVGRHYQEEMVLHVMKTIEDLVNKKWIYSQNIILLHIYCFKRYIVQSILYDDLGTKGCKTDTWTTGDVIFASKNI